MKTRAAVYVEIGKPMVIDDVELPDPGPTQMLVVVDQAFVVPLDNSVATDVTAVIGCAVATGCGAVLNTARVRAGDSVVVFGVGGVGLCAVQAAANVGAGPIIAVNLSDDKLDYARQQQHVSQRFKLEEVNAACDALERGEILGRAILEF